MKRIKVLMVIYDLPITNGVSSYVMNYFRNLNHDAVSMDFVIYRDVETPYKEEIKSAGSRIFLLPPLRDLRAHMKAAKKVIVDGKYDIIHDNILIPSYILMFYAKKYHVPVRILHSHSPHLSGSKLKACRNRLFMPFLIHTITNRIACSQSAALGMFHSVEDCIIVPNVVSAQKFSFDLDVRTRIRKSMKANGKIILGSVGRLAEEKNPFFAMKSVIEARKSIPNLEYWWIGDGDLMAEVKDFITQNHATEYIKLFGNRTDIARLYQAMDIFFLPSFFEGLPVTGLEAQASGLPCIVSDTVSNEFVYTDLVHFFSLSNGVPDVIDAINKIQPFDCNRDRYKKDLLNSKFSDQNAGSLLLDTYQGVYKENIR